MTPSPSAAPSIDRLNEAKELAMLLMAVAEATRQQFEGAAAALELTPPQARALLALAEPTPMRGLASELSCDASNVTGIADRLEAQGLVIREAAPGDRRVKLLVPTAAGQGARAELLTRVTDDAPVMRRLDADDRAQLRDLLTRLLGGAPAEGCSGGPPGDRP